MSTTTPRLGLLKSAPTEVADVIVSIDNAFDILDTSVGIQPVTAFPGSPFSGKMIQRTDLGDKPYYYQATAARFANIPFDTFFAKKAVDQTVNNSVVLVNDNDLAVANLLANATYIFRAYIIYTSTTATPDMRLAFTVPAGATMSWNPNGVDTSATTDSGLVRMAASPGGTVLYKAIGTVAATDMVSLPSGIVAVGATPGTLQFMWCQNNATVENTIVRANSWLYVERVA
jgi:hypothetical protein